MESRELFTKLMDHARLAVQLARLPVARLRFEQRLHPEDVRRAHANFTRRHPRFKVFRNKTMGIALIDLQPFGGRSDGYLETVRHAGYAGAKSRKATARGYRLRPIDRNDHIDEIYAIHTSVDQRQGRPMDSAYLVRKTHYDNLPHSACYGVFDIHGRLSAYCSLVRYGNFVATDQLMGYKNNDGIMELLLSSIVCRLIEERAVDYFMYDTFLGAKQGLREFKRRVGFRPYRARYELV
jgi:hypothetical protein